MKAVTKKNIEMLKIISARIKSWDKTFDIVELSKLLEDLEKITRAEMLHFYDCYMTDKELALKIVSLTNEYQFNEKTLINIVTALGYMTSRYNLEPLNDVFKLFLSLKDVRKINYHVSLHITYFPQFDEWDGKWNYLLSIPKIAPKQKSKWIFYNKIKSIIDSNKRIPNNYKEELIILFEEHLNQTVERVPRKMYTEIIAELRAL